MDGSKNNLKRGIMIKNFVRMEVQVAGKDYYFMADQDSTTGPVKEALCHFIKIIGQIEDQAKAALDQKKPAVSEEESPDIQLEEPIEEVS